MSQPLKNMRMLARTVLLLAILSMMICSCYNHALSYYHKGYKPNLNSKLRFDGYYANKKIAWYKQYYPSAHIDFYRDGFTKRKGGMWGIYKISEDTLTIEYLVLDRLEYITMAYRYAIKQDTLIGLTARSKRFFNFEKFEENLGDTLFFHALSYKPDSSKSYIRKIKRIK